MARPAHLISRAARLLWRLGDLRLRPMGFAVGQMPVLFALKDGASFTQKELATMARTEQPSMAQMLARMKRDGLIDTTPDPKDKRSTLIRLSAAAKARQPEVKAMMEEGNREALAGFSEEEILTLAGLLRRVIDNLEEVADRSVAEPGEEA